MAGLYEAAIEGLCVREIDGHQVRPKIVASTATRVASSFYSRSTKAMRFIAGARDDTKRGAAPSA